MSVYASQRQVSKVEFIANATKLVIYSLEQTNKFPKSMKFSVTNEIIKLAHEIHQNTLKANSVYVHKGMTEMEFQMRKKYLFQARASIFALSSLLTIVFEMLLKGNNFMGDKRKTAKVFKEWARLLNYEARLLKGVIDSDRKRYKDFQKKKKTEIEVEEEKEEIELISEDTFDIPDELETEENGEKVETVDETQG